MADDKGNKGGKGQARPLMVVFQILGSDGNPIDVKKENFKCLTATRDAGKALEAMEENQKATYTRVVVE